MRIVEDLASKLAENVALETEKSIMSQLNDFISRGLIQVEISSHSFIRCPHEDKIEYRQTVNLRLKDREYIERLEKENAAFKKLLQDMKDLNK